MGLEAHGKQGKQRVGGMSKARQSRRRRERGAGSETDNGLGQLPQPLNVHLAPGLGMRRLVASLAAPRQLRTTSQHVMQRAIVLFFFRF